MIAEFVDVGLVSTTIANAVKEVLGFELNSFEALLERSRRLDKEDFPRTQLSSALIDYNERIGADKFAVANARRLSENGAMAIVTGQQAGLFTGPAYSVYKAVTTIKLAKEMQKRTGKTVIPIYWNATDDHDLSEVAHCRFPEREWVADFGGNGRAVETFSIDSVTALMGDFQEVVRQDVMHFFDDRHKRYGEFSSSVISKLFAGTGLVVLEPKLLRPLATDFFKRSVVANEALCAKLTHDAERLERLKINVSFSIDEGTGIFAMGKNGLRRRIRKSGASFEVMENVYTKGELVELIESAPDTISTGAWLRPILQNHLIPTLAYVAGPGEIEYHLQLGGAFGVMQQTMAPLWMRNHVTVLGQKENRIMKGLGWGAADLFRPIQDLRPSNDLPPDLDELFVAGLRSLTDIGTKLKRELSDYSCERTIDGFVSKASKEFDKIRKRVLRDRRMKLGIDNGRIDRLSKALRPNERPQERWINVFYFISNYGRTFIDELIQTLEPTQTKHYVIRPN